MINDVKRRLRQVSIVALCGAALVTIPMSANAQSASATGAYAATYSSNHGPNTGIYVQDTAADNKRAQVDYRRYSGVNPLLRLKATGGNGSIARDVRDGYIQRIKVCALNDNPFDSVSCSAWV